jgi:hypothetical protein
VFRVSPQICLKHVSLRFDSEIRSEIHVGLHVKSSLNISGLNEDWNCPINFREILHYKISWKSVQCGSPVDSYVRMNAEECNQPHNLSNEHFVISFENNSSYGNKHVVRLDLQKNQNVNNSLLTKSNCWGNTLHTCCCLQPVKREKYSQSYFTTGSLPPISSS